MKVIAEAIKKDEKLKKSPPGVMTLLNFKQFMSGKLLGFNI